MRESPAWIQSQSRAGLMRKAATVLCGSSSAVIAVSLIIDVRLLHDLLEQLGRVVVVGE